MGDTRERLSGVTIALHWAIAILIIGMLAFGLFIDGMERGPVKSELIGVHKSIGAIVHLLAAARLFWRLRHGLPAPLGAFAAWETWAAKITLAVLLLGTLAMPLSGIAYSIASARSIDVFGLPFIPQILAGKDEALAETAFMVHGLLANVLIAAIAVHILGALKRHYFDRDGTLRRMLGRRVEPDAAQ